MNILIAHNYYQIPGGEDTVVKNEKLLLESHGDTVIEYTRSNAEMRSFSKWEKLILPITTIFNFQTYREIRKLLREHSVDIVHVHNTLNIISPAIWDGFRIII